MLEPDSPPPQQNNGSLPTYNQAFYDAMDLLNKKTD